MVTVTTLIKYRAQFLPARLPCLCLCLLFPTISIYIYLAFRLVEVGWSGCVTVAIATGSLGITVYSDNLKLKKGEELLGGKLPIYVQD